VIEGFHQYIEAEGIEFRIIAGIETAGIPHSSALAFAMQRPSVFVRKQVKEHGTRSRVEGGDVGGERVLLIEDMVTTGSSSLAGVEGLREAGAVVEDCLCITSYGFPEAAEGFARASVRLAPLAPFGVIVAEAARMGRFGDAEQNIIQAWLADPYGWGSRNK
jgi:orotate phosphoribosyltransferase